MFIKVIDVLDACGKAAKRVMNFIGTQRLACLMVMLCMFGGVAFAEDAVSMTTGVSALEEVSGSIKEYIGPVRKVIYAVAAIVAIGGGISVYVKMNNEEQDVKKSIMMIVGACIFLIAAATALPAFFGYTD